jgi:hypothetical protein
MCFPLSHYTSKNEKKDRECCPKNKTITNFQKKENKEISKDACNKNKKKQEIQKVPTI